jgi:hypothetical protein
VALTTEERRRLIELAGDLALDNPRLARALAGRSHSLRGRGWSRSRGDPRPRRPARLLDWIAISCMVGAVPLLTIGVALGQPVLIVIGAVALVNGPALFVSARVPHAGKPPAA